MTKPRRTKLYAPHGMALDYVKPGKYRIRRFGTKTLNSWVHLYQRGRKVWSCNATFFAAWFVEVK